MCGRSRATLDPQQVAAVLQLRLRGGAGAADEWAARCDDDAAARAPPRASVHPGTELLVAHRAGAAALRVEPMVWGLVPAHTGRDAEADHWRLFNGRADAQWIVRKNAAALGGGGARERHTAAAARRG